MKKELKRIIEILDSMDIRVNIDGDNFATCEFWTDTAGQDIPVEFGFDGTAENFKEKFAKAAESYDVTEEMQVFLPMAGKQGVPSDAEVLLADIKKAKERLDMAARLLAEDRLHGDKDCCEEADIWETGLVVYGGDENGLYITPEQLLEVDRAMKIQKGKDIAERFADLLAESGHGLMSDDDFLQVAENYEGYCDCDGENERLAMEDFIASA